MLNVDPTDFIVEHRRELLAEVEHDRLIASLPPKPSLGWAARNGLAALCYRIAAWLDAPAGYVQMPEPGPEDWLTPWAGA